jgi:hypothetical protein
MSDAAHIIEIDEIILTGAAQQRDDRLRFLIEAEVRRALSGANISTGVAAPNAETNVAGEVARCVARAVRSAER